MCSANSAAIRGRRFTVGRRALEMANRLEDEALAYGARFALGHAYWICGDYDSVIELLSANLPENMRDPTRIRDFGTAGSLLLELDVDSWIDARPSRAV